ncbi:MAG: DUF3455 domain-containing protein, partial [Candidatus Rokuibacteriota bacterium]
MFHRLTFIQRVNTVGGNTPTDPENVSGEVVRVPYTTEYFFYRAPLTLRATGRHWWLCLEPSSGCPLAATSPNRLVWSKLLRLTRRTRSHALSATMRQPVDLLLA